MFGAQSWAIQKTSYQSVLLLVLQLLSKLDSHLRLILDEEPTLVVAQ